MFTDKKGDESSCLCNKVQASVPSFLLQNPNWLPLFYFSQPGNHTNLLLRTRFKQVLIYCQFFVAEQLAMQCQRFQAATVFQYDPVGINFF